ncbi:AMP-binding protein [Austwickia chelonae]|uniref:AMP-binding protein n=1 Tax=Austwickia chelonae TaxID=100225 RepID=UPI001F078133|nr:AMP-binding protein [Austwickia chelonae]
MTAMIAPPTPPRLVDTDAHLDPTRPDPEELYDVDQLRELQFARLSWTVRHAYENVPMYKAKYDAVGVHPDDLRHIEDLAKFPFTDKDDLRQAYPFGTFAVPMADVRRVHASSGTTGRPTVVGYTEGDLRTWAGLVARCMRLSGVRPGDLVQISYGYGLFTGGLGAHYGAERLGCTVVPMSGGQTEKQIQLIEDFAPRAIMCTPTYLLAIMDQMRKEGLDPAATALKVGVLGAEPWTSQMRRELEAGFAITASDIYGLSEVMGPGVAGESAETHDGLHLWEDHFLPEIIDPFADDKVLPDGSEGELVFTSLTKVAMPVIRYRTHDLTRLLPGTARPGHRRMGRLTGRSDDMIILRGVNLFPTQIEEIALTLSALSPHFQLELTRPHRMDELTIHIERRPEASDDEATSAAKELQHLVKSRIGSSARIAVADPGTLPRSMGKLRRIYDNRNLSGD